MSDRSPTPSAARTPEPGNLALFAALALVALVFLVAGARVRPPALDDTVGTRAARTYAADAPDVPHPVGSDANRAYRDVLLARFRELGYEPTVDRSWGIVPGAHTAALVETIVAKLPGAPAGPTVHMLAHYDSVPAGPGAADDGFGVACVLATAAALRDQGPTLRRGVTFVLTDGEEGDLIGATVFARDRGTDDVFAVVNVEARGTSGPALLFETGPEDAWAIGTWAPHAVRPITTSLFADVYRNLPNDTDFTVFRDREVPGVNFACVGDVQHYHTPLDSAANADPRTLAHLQRNAEAAVLAFARADDAPGSSGGAVWFDVLGTFVVRWPVGATAWLAFGAAALVLLWTVLRVVRREIGLVRLSGAILASVATIGCGAASLYFAGALLDGTPGLSRQFVASPGGAIAAAIGAALAGTALVPWIVRRWLPSDAIHAATWLVLAAGAVALAVVAPAVAYLLVVPVGAVAAAGLAALASPRIARHAEAFAGLAAVCVLCLPLSAMLVDAVGVGSLHGAVPPLVAVGAAWVLVGAALASYVAATRRGWIVVVAGLLAAVAGGMAQASRPPSTAERPQMLTVAFAQDEGARNAHLQISPADVPAEVRAAVHVHGVESAQMRPWEVGAAAIAEAAALPLKAPAVRDLRERSADDARRITFRLVSQRGAPVTAIAVAPQTRLRRFTLEGRPIVPETLRTDAGWYLLYVLTTPPEGVAIELDVVSRDPVEAVVEDVSWGLPGESEEAQAAVRARPAWCVPGHWGDRTVVRRRVRL